MLSSAISYPSRLMMRVSRFLVFVVAIVLLAAALLFSASSAHRKTKSRTEAARTEKNSVANRIIQKSLLGKSSTLNASNWLLAMPQAQPSPETIETFAADCATPKTAFILGEVVCAKISGGPPLSIVPKKFAWADNNNNILRTTSVTTDPQTDLFTLPIIDPNVDYRGVWRVNNTSVSRSIIRGSAFFTVSNPVLPQANLVVYNNVNTDPVNVVAGTNVEFALYVANRGPDPAANVQLSNTVASNGTFVDVQQDNGPTFACSGEGAAVTCTIAELKAGEEARIRVIYQSNSEAQAGTVISDTASVSSDTPEAFPDDNTSTAEIKVTSNAGTDFCSLTCPDNIRTTANTTENGQHGAHVTYPDATTSGQCGAITYSQASGSFFPVGSTTVTATSETGSGTCTFVVTVDDVGNVSISCPSDKTADANNNCEAVVDLGNPTTSGDNVTVTVARSDGKPMYDCDNSGNCTRKTTDLPFSAGTTTVTWTAYSHDVAGPYATPEDEEAHRTGTASCTQTVTVNDVTPPTITASDQTVAADANCQAAVPDYSNSASDNCSCASSDDSEACQDRQRIVVTQDVPAGTLLGPGSYQIHLSANDGSSNNNGAGNTTNKTITFTVADQTAPVINCPANIVTGNDPGTCSATVNPGTATATDNCDNSPTINGTRSDNQPLNAPYPKGTTTIHWTATDDANNSSSCDQTVTVNDTENPTISCPASITKSNDPGVCGAVVTYTTPVGQDNCPGATTTQTAGLPSGSTFPVGTTTNTFEVTDSSGNKASCSFTVTVNDTEPPQIACPSSQTLEPTCPSGAIANWTPPVGTDNCPGAVTTRTAGPAPGSVFPIGTTTVTYTVNDAHGNSTSCSFTVTVKSALQTLDDLRASVAANQQLNGTQKNGLLAKLDAAKQLIQNGNQNGACAKLADFVNSTQNFINHGDLSASTGNAWISTANHIRNAIGCTNNPCS